MVAYKATPWGSIYCATKATVHNLSDALRMELKNYGVHVMVVAPGAIRSEIGNANVRNLKLKGNDSLYISVMDRIIARATTSQKGHSTPASECAFNIVEAALKSSPPAYLTTGATSWRFSLLYYLPTWLSDMWVAHLYGSDKVVPV